MIIIGANTEYRDGRIEYWIREQNDIASAKAVTKSNNEAIYCSNHGIVQNWFMFHDTSTDKSWSVYGIGLTKSDYITETTESFIRRIKTMALPTYNRNNRRQSFQQLPKAAYVIKILSAKVARTASGFDQIVIAFDIAEGEYKDFYKSMYDRNQNEDKKWPNDAVFRLTIPYNNCPDYVVTNYDTFFADLEDSNNGFVFGGDEKTLKGKLVGAKMHIEQSEWNGNVYDHTRMKYSAVADDVRNGKAGKLPNDKLIQPKNTSGGDMNGYVNGGFSSSNDEEEIPFD